MAFAFNDLQQEVLRRALRNQGGGQFTIAIQNAINLSMWRIARDAKWRTLRRATTFPTVTTYSTGSLNATLVNNSINFTLGDAQLITKDIRIGRYIKFNGSVIYFKIATITGDTTGTLDQVWDGMSTTTAAWSISPQEEYVLPIQIGHSAFLWHRKYGMPKVMKYVPAYDFYEAGVLDILTNIPVSYRMWGVDSCVEQVKAPSVLTISSSSTADVNIAVTVFGIVSGYPDFEVITTNSTNGTTAVSGLKTFSSVERVVKNQVTTGRITITSNTANVTVSVLPVGFTTTGPMYTKVQVYPLPNSIFPVNVFYYKLPYQLVNAGDVPEIGEEFSEAIILLACAKLKAEQNQTDDSDNFMNLFKDEIDSLKKTNLDKIDWKMILKPAGENDQDQYQGGLRYAQIGGSGQYGGSWTP